MSTPTPNLALPGSVVRGEAPGTWWTYWNTLCANVEGRLTKNGTGDPNAGGGTAGDYIGQIYIQQASPVRVWVCMAAGAAGVAVWGKTTQQYPWQGLVNIAGVVTPNLLGGPAWSYTLSADTTIANPIVVSGSSLVILEITQGASLWNITWGSAYKGVTNGSPSAVGQKTTYVFSVAPNLNMNLIAIYPVPYQAVSFVQGLLAAVQTVNPQAIGSYTAVNNCTGLVMPMADGIKRVRATASLIWDTATASGWVDVFLFSGPLGTTADPIVASSQMYILSSSVSSGSVVIPPFSWVPNNGDKLTLGVTSFGPSIRLLGTAAPPSGGNLFVAPKTFVEAWQA